MAVYLKDLTGCPILLFNQVYRRNLTVTQVLKKDFNKSMLCWDLNKYSNYYHSLEGLHDSL